LKDSLRKYPVQFFKDAAKYIAKHTNPYSFERTIDDSKLSRGGKRKLKRVILNRGAENVTEPILQLARERKFQELYSLTFMSKE
jgi:hypothetical protein